MKSSILEVNPWSIECDLRGDVEKIMYGFLKSKGYSDDELANKNDLLLLYYKDQMLSIPQIPRKVEFSKQFKYPDEYKMALEEFVKRVENGEDLKPFMSERVRSKHNNNDMLLNDWGIYHFHLTRRFRSDGMATRSEYQIFACCDNTTMYFIQVYRHDKKYLYSQEELIKIVDENWSHLLSKYQLKEITALTDKIDDAKRELIRDAHATTITEVNGKFYFPPGGGYASDGSSVTAVRKYQRFYNWLKLLEIDFRNNINDICEYMKIFTDLPINRNLKLVVKSIEPYGINLLELNNSLMFVCSIDGRIDIVIPYAKF